MHPNSINTTHVLNMIRNAWHLVDNARVINLLRLDPTPERIQDVNALLPHLIQVLENMITSENYTAADVNKWHAAYSAGILAMRRAANIAGHPIFPGHVYSFIIATGHAPKAEVATELGEAVRDTGELRYILLSHKRAHARQRRAMGAVLRIAATPDVDR